MTKPNKNNIDEVLEEVMDLKCVNGAMYFGSVEDDSCNCKTRCQNEQTFENATKELKDWIKQKLQQVEEHETGNGYCCACEYDIACMNEKIDIAVQRKVKEIKEELWKKRDAIIKSDEKDKYSRIL